MEELSVIAFPLALNKLTMYAALTREAGEPEKQSARLQIQIGQFKLIDISMDLDFQGKHRTRAIAEFQGLVIPTPGTLRASIVDGDNELGACEVAIVAVAPKVDLFTGPTGPTGPTAPLPSV